MEIIAGTKSLDKEYAEARKAAQQTDAQSVKRKTLRKRRPDLADLVIEQRIPLDEATAATPEGKLQFQRTIKASRAAAIRMIEEFSNAVALVSTGIAAGDQKELRKILTAARLSKVATDLDTLRELLKTTAPTEPA